MQAPAITFFSKLAEYARSRPNEVVLQYIQGKTREEFTWSRLAREVRELSGLLHRTGVTPGDRVAIVMENHPRWGIAFVATVSAGAVAMPLDPSQESEKLAAIIAHAECRVVIASGIFRPLIDAVQVLQPELNVIFADADLDEPSDVALPLSTRTAEDDFVILYTGGTTGTPKGVQLTWRGVFQVLDDTLAVFPLTPPDHVLSILPLFHVMALLANLLAPLYVGAKVTYLNSKDPQRIMSAFAEERITAFLCVPLFYYQVHRRIFEEVNRQSTLKRFVFHRMLAFSRFARRSLGWNAGKLLFAKVHSRFGKQFRGFGTGGARFAPEIAESLHDLGFSFFQGYGMTETSGLAAISPLTQNGGLSSGLPLANSKIRIDEPDEHGIGEILIGGGNIMKGYWRDPEATAAVIRDGWLQSGDIGYLAPDGQLHLTGRKKDVIVLSSGKNVFPEPLEHAYQSQSEVIQEICIIGVCPPGSSTEQLHAVVVPNYEYLKSRQIVNIDNAVRYSLENVSKGLPSYQRVRGFDIRPEPLPRTGARKVKRFQVRQELEGSATAKASALEQEPEPQGPEAQALYEMIGRMKNVDRVNGNMSLELDLAIDSLERVELFMNVENRFGIRIDDEQAAGILAVSDLVKLVEGRQSEASSWRSWTDILNEPLSAEEKAIADRFLSPRLFSAALLFLVAKFAWLLAKLLLRFQYVSIKSWPAGPFLLCPNHQSYLDVILIGSELPWSVFRRLFFLGTSRISQTPLQRSFGEMIRGIPVDPDSNLKSALRLAAEGLRRGLVLCVFPEGHRTIDGQLQPFRKGPSILAYEMKLPVVPVAISGTYEVWGRAAKRIRLFPVSVKVSQPLDPSGYGCYDTLTQQIFEAVREALGIRPERA